MSDLTDDSPPGQVPPRHAPEQGLASVLIALGLLLTAPLFGLTAFLLVDRSYFNPSPTLHTMLVFAPSVLGTPSVLLTLLGGLMGWAGLKRAKQEGGSRSLPVAGLALNLTALLFWVLVAVFMYVCVRKL